MPQRTQRTQRKNGIVRNKNIFSVTSVLSVVSLGFFYGE